MANFERITTFNNYGPVQNQAARDIINITNLGSDHAFLYGESVKSLQQYAAPDNPPGIRQLAADILKQRLDSLTTEADNVIIKHFYNKEQLKIERLSREMLPLEQCYINLIAVSTASETAATPPLSSSEQPRYSIPGSRRFDPEEQEGGRQIQLKDIFSAAQSGTEATRSPKRVLIRGQAGVGKTTFCKKAVHDFVHGNMWKDQFDRILWIRLRNLRPRTGRYDRDHRYDLNDLFLDEFFSQHPNSKDLSAALRSACNDGKTLFLLDGLDEIWYDMQGPHMQTLATFVKHLLNQPNVLVSSRPFVVLSSDIKSIDLELELVGFSLDQVSQYVERLVEPTKGNAIQEFLKMRPLVEDLVRIPIQLDALCYGWDYFPDKGPETMTGLYTAIERGLWRKDIPRLGKQLNQVPITEDNRLYDFEVENVASPERCFLEFLAFSGIRNTVIEFEEKHLEAIGCCLGWQGATVHTTLPELSYLRTSDNSVGKSSRTYHFLHLTFQDYFAARYFVRTWQTGGNLMCLDFQNIDTVSRNPLIMDPRKFLAKHKYTLRYDIMWRFVAGLFHSGAGGSDKHELQFLKAVNAEPLDLLGMAHQRLIMHCIAELRLSRSSSKELKTYTTRLENHLGTWAMSEIKANHESGLIKDLEFPNRVHLMMLEHEDKNIREHALSACVKWSHSRMPIELSKALICLLQCSLPELQDIPDHACLFRKRPDLGQEENFYRHSGKFLSCFGPPRKWSEDVSHALVGYLGSGSNDGWKRQILLALDKDPIAASSHVRIISSLIKDKMPGSTHCAMKVLSKQQRLPRQALERIARVPYFRMPFHEESKEISFKILTENCFWNECLTSHTPAQVETEERNREPGQLASTCLALLTNRDPETATVATLALGYHTENLDRPTISKIRENLVHGEEQVRWASIKALGHQAHLLPEDLRAISICFGDPDQLRCAVLAITECGRRMPLVGSEDVLCSLVMCLRRSHQGILEATTEALRHQGQLPEYLIRAMVSCLQGPYFPRKDPSPWGRGNRLPRYDEQLLSDITFYLQKKYLEPRWGALALFISQPKLPEMVLRAVVICLQDERREIRQQAEIILKTNHLYLTEDMHASMRDQLKNKSIEIRMSICRVLLEVTDSRGGLLDLIETILQDPNYEVREMIITIDKERIPSLDDFQKIIMAFLDGLPADRFARQFNFLSKLVKSGLLLLNEVTRPIFMKLLASFDPYTRRENLHTIAWWPNLSQETIREIQPFLHGRTLDPSTIAKFAMRGGGFKACMAGTDVVVLAEGLFANYLKHRKHVAWYIEDGETSLETEHSVERVALKDPAGFATAVRKTRKKLDLLDVVPRGINSGSSGTRTPLLDFIPIGLRM